MFLIVGLGNPGPQYVGTRHNAGFELVDHLADEANIEINKNKFKSMIGEGFAAGKKVVLQKPMTFMNLSGEAVVQALNFYKPKAEEFIVVYDDMALKPGAIRIRERGSAGGHNGMKSIIGLTGTDEFTRIRIGVGGPKGNVISHVLGKFSKEEEDLYVKGLELAREAVKTILTQGVAEAMNKYNSSGKPPKTAEPKKKPELNPEPETGKKVPKGEAAAETRTQNQPEPSDNAANAGNKRYEGNGEGEVKPE